jgi:hypothetical protein
MIRACLNHGPQELRHLIDAMRNGQDSVDHVVTSSRRKRLSHRGRSRRKDSRDVFKSLRNDVPPHPPASLLTNDEPSLGKNPGVMRDGRLAFS